MAAWNAPLIIPIDATAFKRPILDLTVRTKRSVCSTALQSTEEECETMLMAVLKREEEKVASERVRSFAVRD